MSLATVVDAFGPALLAAQGDAPAWLLILGPAGAGAFYYGVWSFYRNSDKSHSFELETRVDAKAVTGTDVKISEITGTKKSGIDNANHEDHRERVQRIS